MSQTRAICYQEPDFDQTDKEEIIENELRKDLKALIENQYHLIRLYDITAYTETLLKLIYQEKIPIKVLLGISFKGEVINQNTYNNEILKTKDIIFNKRENQLKVEKLIKLANEYESIISMVSVGNESQTSWTIQMVSIPELTKYIKMVKKETKVLVTYCENAYFWNTQASALAKEVDVVGINLHPFFQNKPFEEAISYLKAFVEATKENLGKPVFISETGYPYQSDNPSIISNKQIQMSYIEALMKFQNETDIQVFIYEAFKRKIRYSLFPHSPYFEIFNR